ncbi:MAG: hypothetical protein J0M28_07360 [Thauera sp.]|nr:hypothetical protein [Thauera sp.]
MLRRLLTLAVLLAALSVQAAAPRGEARADHAGDRECVACHAEQARLWSGSKHDRAMQAATPATVLGNFDGASFTGTDQRARFSRRADEFIVRTPGADGKDADFPVAHTFGVYPLQQYLLPLPGGRLQALSIAWDVRNKRWFSLYPEGGIAPGTALHWSGRYQNWNLMCGECHTTAFAKGYEDETDDYRTTWVEPNVGCQACHGPGAAHIESARSAGTAGQPPSTAITPTANRLLGSAHAQVDQCAACHSRRTRLQEITLPGRPFLDNFVPDNLRPDLYHADGQQLEEVFEYGSFRQSRMYQAGVGCGDCHEPHSGKTRAAGNALCLSCHNPAPDTGRFSGLKSKDYDSPSHHFHTTGTPGSACVSCHMPSRNYMIVHERRDHAIRIPRPDLSRRIGTPNACQSCHADRPAEWAEAAIARHLGAQPRLEHYGEVFAAARKGDADAGSRLAALIGDGQQPAIVRATAIELLAAIGTEAPSAAALRDADPVVRVAAAAAWSARSADERLAHLPPLLADPIRAVRITAARGLADFPEDRLPTGADALRRTALDEFVAAQRAMADMPSAQMNLAALATTQGKLPQAERHYRIALTQDPAINAARLSFAQLLAASRRMDEARRVLRDGLAKSPNPGELHFALGLLAGQARQWEEAASELETAARLLPADGRIRRNLDIVHRQLRAAPAR